MSGSLFESSGLPLSLNCVSDSKKSAFSSASCFCRKFGGCVSLFLDRLEFQIAHRIFMCHALRPTIQDTEEEDIEVQGVPESENEGSQNTIRVDSWPRLREETLCRNAHIHRRCLIRR